MKRLLSLALALIMTASAVACSNTNVIPPSDTTIDIDINTTVPETTIPKEPETSAPETTVPETTVPETTVPETTAPETTVPETTAPPIEPPVSEKSGYTIVREIGADNLSILNTVRDLNLAIKKKSGKELLILPALGASDPDKKEILVGKTGRQETKEVLDAIGDYGYAVKQIGNKIVIVGTDKYATAVAVDYFTAQILSKCTVLSDGNLSFPKNIDYVNASNESVVLYDGTKASHVVTYTKNFTDKYLYSYYDYSFDEKTIAEELVEALQNDLSARFLSATDTISEGENVKTSYEILLGDCDRDETRAVKAELGYNEYKIKVMGNKIVVMGLGILTTYQAMYKFIDLLKEFKTSEGITLPSNFEYTGIYSRGKDWIVDIPEYKGGRLDSVSDIILEGCSYVIKIKETTLGEYNSYLSVLERSGYTKYTDNNIDGNLFTTYTSDGKGTLRVQFIPAYSQTNIIVESSDVVLPIRESDDKSVAITDTKLVQLKIANENSENGQCHIFRLNDGRFIIFDGGGENDSSRLIFEKLTKLNVLPGKPVIAAWIFTHHHGDHTGTFANKFSKTYKSQVTIENYIYSFPSEYYLKDQANNFNAWSVFRQSTNGGNQITPHTGDVWYFGDLKMTCIYTQADHLPDTFEFYNDSSSTFMFEIGGQKILITGDASENSCNTMLDMYPTYLKCDILQVPHHGHYGANNAFMDATDPWVALIPASEERWLNKLRLESYEGAAPLRYLLDKRTLKEYYIHGQGTVTFDLPYKGR